MTRDAGYHEAKYRVKISHYTEQGFDINGIIHVGANDGYEVAWYQKMGIENILCIEPLSTASDVFKDTYPDVPCLRIALSDYNGTAKLNVAVGDGKGSSLLDPIEDHPEVQAHWDQGQGIMVGEELVPVMRLDTLAVGALNIGDYDCLLLDTQGNELEVLKGCGDLLQQFKYLVVELSTDPVYDGEHPGQEVIDWLTARGFTQDSPLVPHDDVMMIRSDIKPTSDQTYQGLA